MMGGVGRAGDIEILAQSLRDVHWERRVEALRAATARLAGGDLERDSELQLREYIVAAAKDEKWEVRKAAAQALAQMRHANNDLAEQTLQELAKDVNRWVSQAAARAKQTLMVRAQHKSSWTLTEDTQNPTLRYVAEQIRKVGLRSLNPARIYHLIMEVGEQFYREFAADTAHEIRTLLTPLEGDIVGLHRHLDEVGAADTASQRHLSAALEHLLNLQRLVEQLQTYSAPADADFEPVNLVRVIEAALSLAGESVADRIQLRSIHQEIHVPAGLVIEALPDRLTRAVANIIVNAYQAMPAGGSLTVRAVLIAADSIELTVSDTGHGMSPEDAEHALERFRTTRRHEGGTGLGLPIARRIVEHDHGGELSVRSALGEGTTVCLALPVRRSSREE